MARLLRKSRYHLRAERTSMSAGDSKAQNGWEIILGKACLWSLKPRSNTPRFNCLKSMNTSLQYQSCATLLGFRGRHGMTVASKQGNDFFLVVALSSENRKHQRVSCILKYGLVLCGIFWEFLTWNAAANCHLHDGKRSAALTGPK